MYTIAEPGTLTVISFAMMPTSLRDRVTPGGSLRILLAERKASAHSELSHRLRSRGHEVLARVTSAQGAIDYAGFLSPDVVLVSPLLEDAPGLTEQAVTEQAVTEQAVTDMVDALYSPPAIELVTAPVVPGTRPSNPMQETDDDAIARATSALVERARLTHVTAMRLMEQEACSSGQSVADVARAMLFDVESETIEVLAPGE